MANPNDTVANENAKGSDAERARADDSSGHEQRSFQTPAGADSDDPPEDHYEPSAVEVTRAREQGLGLGARDLQLQRDARRPSAPPDEDDRADGE